MPKISELTPESTPSVNDTLVVVDSTTNTTRKMTVQQLQDLLSVNLSLSGNIAKVITGAGAPTTSTIGDIGDIYVDTVSPNNTYTLVSISGSVYTWKLNGGSSSTPVGVIATLTASQGNASGVTIIFDQDGSVGTGLEALTCFNSGAYNKSTGVFTVPENGIYAVDVTLSIGTGNTSASPAYGTASPFIEITRGGTTYNAQFDSPSAGYFTNEAIPAGDTRNFNVSVSRKLNLLVGDLVKLKCYIGGAGTSPLREIQGGGGYGRTMMSILKI